MQAIPSKRPLTLVPDAAVASEMVAALSAPAFSPRITLYWGGGGCEPVIKCQSTVVHPIDQPAVDRPCRECVPAEGAGARGGLQEAGGRVREHARGRQHRERLDGAHGWSCWVRGRDGGSVYVCADQPAAIEGVCTLLGRSGYFPLLTNPYIYLSINHNNQSASTPNPNTHAQRSQPNQLNPPPCIPNTDTQWLHTPTWSKPDPFTRAAFSA